MLDEDGIGGESGPELRGRSLPAFRSIARELERQVLVGDLPVGGALPSETTLAKRFGVSRSTIREAIRVMEQIGLIRRDAGRNKLRITAPQTKEIGAQIKTAFLLQETTFEQLWEVLSAIEPACAASAALRAGEEDLRKIEDNIRRTEQRMDDNEALVELDIEFHNLVAAATGNGALELSRGTVGELFYPAFAQVMARLNAGERLLLAHRKIHEAIVARDDRQARLWMERHIGDFLRGCDLANLDIGAPITGGMTKTKHD
ncbi:MAG: FadR/GntR family transcriptional regulator [Mesorhizobium sp.]